MGRPPKLTEEVRKIITKIKDRHPNWSIREIEEKIPQFEPRLVGKVPGRTKIGEFIKEKYTPQKTEVDASGIDRPWHLGAPENNTLQPEDIAAIVEVQAWLDSQRDKPGNDQISIKSWTEFYTNNQMTTSTWSLTVREALWVVKLYKVKYFLTETERLYLLIHNPNFRERDLKGATHQKLQKLFLKHNVSYRRSLIENISTLWYAVKTYADYQRLCDLAGTSFDTTRLDDALRNGSIGKIKLDLFSEYKAKKEGAQ